MTEEAIAIAKTAPAVTGAVAYGLTLQEWVAVATLLYVLLQAGLLVPKYWRLLSNWFNGKRD